MADNVAISGAGNNEPEQSKPGANNADKEDKQITWDFCCNPKCFFSITIDDEIDDELPKLRCNYYRISRKAATGYKQRTVKIVHISDTHGDHDRIKIPKGDVLIHSGDFFTWNKVTDLNNDSAILDSFFAKQPHKHKIFVAGNHEHSFRGHSAKEIQSKLHHVTYLQDSSVKVEGLVIYGSPWTVQRYSPAKAFTEPMNTLESKHWAKIPENVDILVTHSPPKYILDDSGQCGCPELRHQIFNRIRPMAHLFGHAHHVAQAVVQDDILFSNGAQADIYSCRPVIIDICPATLPRANRKGNMK